MTEDKENPFMVVRYVFENTNISQNQISENSNISQQVFQEFLKKYKLHPCKIQLCHHLYGNDFYQ